MHILTVTTLALPDIQVVKNGRFRDERGYFVEAFRPDKLLPALNSNDITALNIEQVNESYSKAGVIRGLHTQSSPNLTKILRVVSGKIIDIALDIRPHSPTYGQAVAYELHSSTDGDDEEVIVIPYGFAHGFIALEDSKVQYFQTGTWNKDGEACITITDPDIDWHLTGDLAAIIKSAIETGIMSDKDKQGLRLSDWRNHPLASKY